MLPMHLHGRRKIYSATGTITADNVVSEVNKAMPYHIDNFREIEYLYWYRRGMQPILGRQKQVRPEINNRIVLNNAEEVVSFKNGYFLIRPATYVSRKSEEKTVNKVKQLNEWLYASGKHDVDNDIVDWFHTVGIAVAYAEPNKDEAESKNVPYKAYSLDPRQAFVVYSMRAGNEPLMGINVVLDGEGKAMIDVFTKDNIFRLSGGYLGDTIVPQADKKFTVTAQAVESIEPNIVGEIPIVEYVYNNNRMGVFEKAIDIMDAINLVESNRIDGIEQTVQSLCIATNCDFEEGTTANTIREAGMICIKSTNDNKADFKIMNESLDQSQTQTTLDDLYAQMLRKCAMPDTTKGGTSAADTGTAVYLRDGYSWADADARNTTDLFMKANRQFDKVILKILESTKNFKLSLTDFELKIERNSTSNLLVKTQAAMNMKELGFAPEIAFERSGLSNDPHEDIEISREYIDKVWKAEEEKPEEDPMAIANPLGENGDGRVKEQEVLGDGKQHGDPNVPDPAGVGVGNPKKE